MILKNQLCHIGIVKVRWLSGPAFFPQACPYPWAAEKSRMLSESSAAQLKYRVPCKEVHYGQESGP